MMMEDAILGWRHRPGVYKFPRPGLPNGATVTLLSDGSRATKVRPRAARQRLAIFGCSFTQGWALADEMTYPWRLQRRFPGTEVKNFGTPGYGTYQSLLMLERQLRSPRPPNYVIYAFIQHHQIRNAAPVSWLKTVSLGAQRGHAKLPYVSLDEKGTLLRHPPVAYPVFSLSEYSAVLTLAQDVYAGYALDHALHPRKVTQQLILEMAKASRQAKARFLVVILAADEPTRRAYAEYLEKNAIKFIDCVIPDLTSMSVPGWGHPNEQANALWAKCIGEGIVAAR